MGKMTLMQWKRLILRIEESKSLYNILHWTKLICCINKSFYAFIEQFCFRVNTLHLYYLQTPHFNTRKIYFFWFILKNALRDY